MDNDNNIGLATAPTDPGKNERAHPDGEGMARVGTARVGAASMGTPQLETAQLETASVGTPRVGTAQRVGTTQRETTSLGAESVGPARLAVDDALDAAVGDALGDALNATPDDSNDLLGATANPRDSALDPLGAAADPLSAVVDPLGTSADPLSAVADPLSAAADPHRAPADPLGSATDPHGASADPLGATTDSNVPNSNAPNNDGSNNDPSDNEAAGNEAVNSASSDALGPAEIALALSSPEVRANPYPLYEAAHRIGPVQIVADGFALVVGYAEVNQILRNPGFGVWDREARESVWPAEMLTRPSLNSMRDSILNANAPHHGRMRSLVSAAFSPRRIAELEPAVAATVDRMLEEMAEKGADGTPVEFMDEFAYRLPILVICELMGIPADDRPRFRQLASDLAVSLDVISELSELDEADVAAIELQEYFTALVVDRRTTPSDDLISALIAISDADEGRLSPAELLANLTLLLVAGFETTANLIGNGLQLLFDHPSLVPALRDGTITATAFVEEVLRYDSPVQLTSRLALADDLEVAGTPIPRDWEVLTLLGAANRDPNRYPSPDVFDPTRPDINPLSFSAGPHFCLGSVLARLEATTVFPRLLTRFPALAPAGEPVRNNRLVLRGYAELPVTVGRWAGSLTLTGSGTASRPITWAPRSKPSNSKPSSKAVRQ